MNNNPQFKKPTLKRTESVLNLKECQNEVTLENIMRAIKDVRQEVIGLRETIKELRDIIEKQDSMEDTSQDMSEEEWEEEY